LKMNTLISLQNELASSPVSVSHSGGEVVQKQAIAAPVQRVDTGTVAIVVAGLALTVTTLYLYVNRQKKVKDDYIKDVLKDVKNKRVREQLHEAWNALNKDGNALYESDSGKHKGGFDTKVNKLILRIPEQGYMDSADSQLDKKAIAVHELTHVAEVIANTKGKKKMTPGKDPIMESDSILDEDLIENLFNMLDKDKSVLRKIPFSSVSTGAKNKNMYDFIEDRLLYANQFLAEGKNFELPTVVNQMIYVMDAKGGEILYTKVYIALHNLQNELAISREKRR
ncbi:MAG: hypothetical protein WBA74_14240, partial [Cyclobacteriaceae bacterium]